MVSSGKAGQFPCPQEDAGEHGAVETSRIGVAQRWVVGGQEVQAVGQKVVRAVGETILGFANDDAGFEQKGEIAVEGNLSQADDDADARQSLDLVGEVSPAVANLLRLGLVAGRGAADDRGDPGVAQLKAVVAGDGARFAGQAELVENRVHEVARAVAGEGTAGTVGSVGSGGKPDDEDTCAGVAKAWDGPSPIGLVLVGAALGFADAAAVVAKAGATLAADDGTVNPLEELGRNLCAGRCHCIPS